MENDIILNLWSYVNDVTNKLALFQVTVLRDKSDISSIDVDVKAV